ncbi:class I SAM-dependent DNA methyltransferase [Anaerococcus degeneri]|uniref:Class I SAM-dependent methyltransferase n=1 Tax=Anaerococcus degeneri TaxID=361500 RepID=A0ABS7YZ47_9FIRM|nr:class I SAM-dependent methyltransferase [Anaerococcus degeneri]MBP2014789.1 putative TPR repeat methyltransferase [Anaerococcus degeneri]MCA2096998.1 class I SAM-dependent methyltransferase [Anaerococcus degeneri]
MYGEFSYIYDKLSFDIDYEGYAQNIKDLAKDYKIGNENMLELACGSGMLTQCFFDDFERIDALDISTDMLNCFAEKYDNDKVNLIYYDMVEYEKKDFYDLIVILLDSVNYVTNPADLEKLFRNSFDNLKDNSLLVFDINSEMKMREIFGSECYVYEYEDIFYTWDNYLEEDLIDMNLNFFVENPDGSYRRIEEYQQERIYSINYVKTLLEKVGFTDIRIYDEDTLDDVNEETLRVLFSARKAAK